MEDQIELENLWSTFENRARTLCKDNLKVAGFSTWAKVETLARQMKQLADADSRYDEAKLSIIYV